MLNRGAIIVRPRAPYHAWAVGLDDSNMSPSDNDERTVYLIPSFEVPEQGREILEDLYLEIFERELEAWHTDESAWPTARTFEVFCEWFDIEMHSIVEDLCGDLITDDEVNE